MLYKFFLVVGKLKVMLSEKEKVIVVEFFLLV